MTDTEKLARAEAELAATKRDLEAHRAALTPPPFKNTTVTPAMMEASRQAQKARVDAAIKERQARDAAALAEREAAVLAEGRQRLEDFKGQSRQRFINNGASDADFERAWPAMKQQWLTEQSALDPKERRIAEMAAKLRNDPRYVRF